MKLIALLFALLITAIGVINTFWGNDPGYGIFVILASLLYYPRAAIFLQRKTGIVVPLWIKVVLALFIFWTAFGVAELFDKIDLMVNDLASIL